MMMMIMNAVQMCELVKRLLKFSFFADFLNAYSSKVTGVFYIWYQSPATTLGPQEWANMIIAGLHLEEELRWRFDHIEVRSSSINV